MFTKILIANRGEIACRIIRTARRMGIRTVAVYSDADQRALHVTMADEAIRIGAAPAAESYLDAERVIAAARITGAEAIHPGYGFLSENPDFVDAVVAANLTFIGPSAASIRAMGLKDAAKRLMEQAGVPVVPGYHGEAQDIVLLASKATEIGYPVLIKARAGGGGRGMRRVDHPGDFAEALSSARREAKAAFGDDHMLIEKYVDNPRHIEVQVIGDSHGNLVSLFERECTLQRRHQKVVEEAPSPTLDAAQRETICAAARKAAGAVGYVGAGTVEFVSDGRDVFFIEMNTRLQVEHPVTELISGVDLVEWQLRVAFGEKLPLTQDQLRLNGHAVEVRLYAENPHKNFMPSVGRISTWRMPPERDGLRIDAGYRKGASVTPYYDAMLAKVIAYGNSREVALARLKHALEEADVRGVVTNIPFLTALVAHQAVRANAIDTGFIERELAKLTPPPAALSDLELAAAVAAVLAAEQAAARDAVSPWLTGGWMPVGRRSRTFAFRQGASEHKAVLRYGPGGATLVVGEREVPLSFAPRGDDTIEVTMADVSTTVAAVVEGRQVYIRTRNGRFELALADPFGVADDEQGGHDRVVAPLPGTVVALLAQEGAMVEKGDPILTLEVMKMEQTLRAPYAGTLTRLKCAVGDIVQEGAELAEIEPAEAGSATKAAKPAKAAKADKADNA